MQNCRSHSPRVRRAAYDDLEAITAILAESGLQVWSKESLRGFVEEENSLFRVLVEGARCRAFLLSRTVVDELEILILAVALCRRRRGYGQELLDDTIEEALKRGIKKCFLEVRADHDAAVNLYVRNGFQVKQIRKGYYEKSGQDALIMSRTLREIDRS